MQLTDAQRLRLGTAFIEHTADLWPEGEPAATPDWIRAHVDDILAALDQMLRRDGRDVLRLPRRLTWLLWLLSDLDQTISLDGCRSLRHARLDEATPEGRKL